MQRTLDANGVHLCAETFGDRSDPPLLLISGASGSMDWWRTEFCERLADGGRWVIRYDHRDTGQSTHSTPGAPDYTGADLVSDPLGLLDALDVESAQIAGISMGGGIGQVLAVEQPDRVASLILMSTSPGGGDDLPSPSPELSARFANPPEPPGWSNRDQVVDYIVEDFRAYAGTLSFDADEVRALAGVVVDRTIDIEAGANHWMAGDGEAVRARIGQINAPTLVIHGTEDPLFPLPHAEALAREIPGARLLVIEGMGHEVPPPQVWDEVIGAMLQHTSR